MTLSPQELADRLAAVTFDPEVLRSRIQKGDAMTVEIAAAFEKTVPHLKTQLRRRILDLLGAGCPSTVATMIRFIREDSAVARVDEQQPYKIIGDTFAMIINYAYDLLLQSDSSLPPIGEDTERGLDFESEANQTFQAAMIILKGGDWSR